ncbi:type I DNA topoisomerase [Candidatus Parcubacteria bacterium]|nr:type I DNA topoisomerase [Candidatus Parcubacteria bacterium]
MFMNLILVESPTKSKTIQSFLSSEYKVLSSYGHIRDLPKSELGIDIENDFKPKYVIPLKSRKVVSLLKKESQKADLLILATDEDREGEAIAYHLSQILNLNGKKHQRIVFHEITKQAIEEALKNPRDIDISLFNAQQARRVLDRLVGYKLSPLLWKKVARGLSAGRVQSVTVRLIVEREREIENFKPEEYWLIEALLQSRESNAKNEFLAKLIKKDNKVIPKLGIKTKNEAEKIVKDLKGAEYKVVNIEKKEIKRNPLPPFTTSTLQQESWKRLRWPAKLTMRTAQGLYEKGLITYHRTDSLNLSEMSLFAARKFIIDNLGKEYWAGFLKKYKTKAKGAQEAHEAIRPAYPDKEPDKIKIKEKLDDNQFRLYDLIWRRFIACQMAQACFDSTTINISAKNYIFRVSGQTLKFDGFLKIYPIKFEETELPLLEGNEILELLKLISSQHFTQPPGRYTEASLIKVLEENGIGRPSTYAPTISTIQERNYVQKNENKKFQPTEIGILVNDLLVKHFPNIVDIKFTAEMEKDLDEIAEGKRKWVPVIKEFYEPFEKNLKVKEKEIDKKEIAEEETNEKCPECGSPLVKKMSRFGKFYACSNFPKCRYIKPLERPSLNIKCPKCSKGEIVEKRTKKGKTFYACNQYPKCDFALWDKPINEKCPECGSLLVQTKKGQVKCSNKECDYKRENF